MNKVILEGKISDPPKEIAFSGGIMATIKLATVKDTAKGPITTWHALTAFKPLAEKVLNAKPGDSVHAEGELQYRKGQDGKLWTNIKLDRFDFMTAKEDMKQPDPEDLSF